MPTKPTKRRAGKRVKRQYVVGYKEDHQLVYGQNDGEGNPMYCGRLTMDSASKLLRTFPCDWVDRVIYKLVPVRVVRGRKP